MKDYLKVMLLLISSALSGAEKLGFYQQLYCVTGDDQYEEVAEFLLDPIKAVEERGQGKSRKPSGVAKSAGTFCTEVYVTSLKGFFPALTCTLFDRYQVTINGGKRMASGSGKEGQAIYGEISDKNYVRPSADIRCVRYNPGQSL